MALFSILFSLLFKYQYHSTGSTFFINFLRLGSHTDSVIFHYIFSFFCDNNHKWVLFLDLCLHRIPRTHQSRALAGVVASVGRDTGHGTPEHHSQLSVGSQPDNTWSHVALRPPLGNPPPSDKMSEPKLTKFALGTMFLQASVNYLFS